MREGSVGRAVLLGEYIIETGATVRAAAKVFKISKSTVHTAVTVWNGLCGWYHKNRLRMRKKHQNLCVKQGFCFLGNIHKYSVFFLVDINLSK